ncbi:hypothetical protein HELRODRAFT_75869 [Helobdella robusta]|uniref:Uncharacterized protein n=1 Tax=Helobdella robusta TaxID=6412 RepID=T1G2B8_HELRO|nr:hypothetical protein HELRODRAFT_75869 [Helobdella robusta]ESO07734.1 hypothetical protein HELRODRAFT_75869 [Helobdella robusta]
MFLSYDKVSKVLGMTMYELWINLVCILLSSVLLVLKLEDVLEMSWFIVFTPMFVCSGLLAYLIIIMYIRSLQSRSISRQSATFKMFFSSFFTIALFSFYLLVCLKLNNLSHLSFSIILTPLYLALVVSIFQVCKN